MGKELSEPKSKLQTSNRGPVIEGADLGSGVTSGSSNGAVILDDRLPLNLEQTVNLRNLYQARKEIEERIGLAEQMLGINGREIIGGHLGDDNPHLMLKPAIVSATS